MKAQKGELLPGGGACTAGSLELAQVPARGDMSVGVQGCGQACMVAVWECSGARVEDCKCS